MTYSQVLKNLEARGFFQIKPGLERMERVSAALGHPERQWAALHIAGTNGKGSVSATLENILRQAGYKTGLYTSPHLVSLAERIRINGRPIPDTRFAACGSRLIAVEKTHHLHLTYFEFLTALAFLYFAEEGIDIGVIECGMGGRWDATNIIPRPVVSVITSIGLDHTAWLGNTLDAIAREKAGIIKEHGITVTGVSANVQPIFFKVAAKQKNLLLTLNHDFKGSLLREDWKKPLQSWRYHAGGKEIVISTPLMGRHQVDNGALSLTVVELLRRHGWLIPDDAVARGFLSVKWPGRLQLFHWPGQPWVMLDGAHNPHAMQRLLDALREPAFKRRRMSFIFSAFSDKDVAAMGRQLGPMARRIYVCEMSGQRRSTLAELAQAFSRFRAKLVLCPGGVEAALARAWDEARPSDCLVATGSLMLVGEILKRKRLFHG